MARRAPRGTGRFSKTFLIGTAATFASGEEGQMDKSLVREGKREDRGRRPCPMTSFDPKRSFTMAASFRQPWGDDANSISRCGRHGRLFFYI
jgi:hypothetical protein